MTSSDVAKLLGIPIVTLGDWVRENVIVPSHRGSGQGRYHRFSVRDVFAISIGRDLRRRGFTLRQAGSAVKWLFARSIKTLAEQWAAGQTLMLVVGDAMPFPRLLTRDEVFNNPDIDLVAASSTGLPIAVIDVAAAYRVLQQKIRQHRAGDEAAGGFAVGNENQLGSIPVEPKVPA